MNPPVPVTLWVTLTLTDGQRWPELAAVASSLGGHAAVLQGTGPSLVAQLDALAAQQVASVHLVGVTFGQDLGPISWLGRVARWWLLSRDSPLTLWWDPRPLRTLPSDPPSLAAARRLRPGDSLSNPAWQDPPPVARHVLVCRGPRCNAKGAAEVQTALTGKLEQCGALDESVLVTATGCVYPCNRAPIVVVQPDMAWLGPMDPTKAAELAAQLSEASR